MPVTGMAIETVSQLWGRTTNGFNRALVSGGSSGGEGALVGMYGSPLGVGTDIAGSIRVPCAFNGLYGIRPSTRRLSYEGMTSNVSGGRAIAAAIGPMCHSVRDVELICRIVTEANPWEEDPGVVQMRWTVRPSLPGKLTIGLMKFDGVVMPHPPILRGLDEAAARLRAAGHEVVDFKPYQHQRAWDIAVGRLCSMLVVCELTMATVSSVLCDWWKGNASSSRCHRRAMATCCCKVECQPRASGVVSQRVIQGMASSYLEGHYQLT